MFDAVSFLSFLGHVGKIILVDRDRRNWEKSADIDMIH